MGVHSSPRDINLPERFELSGIPPAPRDTLQIEVTFGIDVNGYLDVSVTYKGNVITQKLAVTQNI